VLGPGLLATGNYAFGSSKVEDHVASVEPLDLACEELADPVAVLPPNDLALRFFDLLVDDLLRRLGGDTGQGNVDAVFHRLDHRSQLGIGSDLAGVLDRNLDVRIHRSSSVTTSASKHDEAPGLDRIERRSPPCCGVFS
jgi:hypothetical protein